MVDTIIAIIYSFGFAYVVYLDANSFKKRNEALYLELIKKSPKDWAILSLFLFIVAAPVYYLRRTKFIKRNTEKKNIFQEDLAQDKSYFISQASGIIILWSFIVLGLTAFIHLGNIFFESLNLTILFSPLPTVILVVLIYRACQNQGMAGFWNQIGFKTQGKSIFKIFIAPIFIGVALSIFSYIVLFGRSTIPITPLSQAVSSQGYSWITLLFMASAILLIPFLEEVVFRGYFFSVISRFKSRIFTVCVIAFIFSFMHIQQYLGDWMLILVVVLLGMCLTSLRAYTDSIIPSLIVHYSYNTLIVLIPIIAFVFSSPPYFKYLAFYDSLDDSTKEELLNKSIEKHPGHIEAYNAMAWDYAKNGKNLDKAFDLIETALLHEPENPAYLDTKAEVLFRLQKYKEAILIEADLVKKYPENSFYVEQLDKFMKAFSLSEAGKEEKTFL